MAAPFCHDEAWIPWNGTDFSWVGTGNSANMLFACTPYDPEEYAPMWYNRVGLVVICLSNSLALILIALRTYFRWRKARSFGKEDWWIMAAGVILLTLYFPALLVSNRMGSGLYVENIPFKNRQALWLSMSGWAFYFIISSMIKVATCMYYIRIVPDHRTRLQHFIYILATAIVILGLVEAGIWVLNCSPIEANFIYNVEGFSCPPVDKARWSWIIFSIAVDIAILWVPWHILRKCGLPTAEKRVLRLVFGANLLGTMACAANIYGVWARYGPWHFDNHDHVEDFTHAEAAFILINNGEVLMYVLGACFPVLSPYLVSLARSTVGSGRRKSETLPSWRVSPIDAHQYARRESQAKRYTPDPMMDTVLESMDRASFENRVGSGERRESQPRLGTATTMAVSLHPDFGSSDGHGLGLLRKTSSGEYILNIGIPEEAHIRPTAGNTNSTPAMANSTTEQAQLRREN